MTSICFDKMYFDEEKLWKQHSFAKEFQLLDGNPLEASAWRIQGMVG